METGLEALAGSGGTSPAKASSPALVFSTIHYLRSRVRCPWECGWSPNLQIWTCSQI
jgi:hypothetical protein